MLSVEASDVTSWWWLCFWADSGAEGYFLTAGTGRLLRVNGEDEWSYMLI